MNLSGHFRLGISISPPMSIPVNVVTATLLPYTGLTGSSAFGSNVPIIAASDGSAFASAGVVPGTWSYSNAVTNTTTGNLAGQIWLVIDLTGLTASQVNQGRVFVTLQNSPDGSAWPDDGVSILEIDPIPVVAGKVVKRLVKV